MSAYTADAIRPGFEGSLSLPEPLVVNELRVFSSDILSGELSMRYAFSISTECLASYPLLLPEPLVVNELRVVSSDRMSGELSGELSASFGTADAIRPGFEGALSLPEPRVVNELRVFASDIMLGTTFQNRAMESEPCSRGCPMLPVNTGLYRPSMSEFVIDELTAYSTRSRYDGNFIHTELLADPLGCQRACVLAAIRRGSHSPE